MLEWKCLNILSYGAGTPSTTLALMSCENAYYRSFPEVPANNIYHATYCPHPEVPSMMPSSFAICIVSQAGYTPRQNLQRLFVRK